MMLICGWYFWVWRWKLASKLFKTLDCRRAQLWVFWVYTFQFYLMLKDQPSSCLPKCALYVMFSVKASLQITKMTHMPRTPHGPLAKRFSSRFFGKSSMSSLRKPSQAQKNPDGSDECNGLILRKAHKFSRILGKLQKVMASDDALNLADFPDIIDRLN